LTDRRRIEPAAPDPELLAEAARRVASGGVIVFPTRHLYGLGADALNPEAVGRVFALKGRSPAKALSVLVRDESMLTGLVREVPASARLLMERFWPGRLTLVLAAAPGVPEALSGGRGTIGVRLPGHPVSRGLMARLAVPLTATSANRAGEPGAHTVDAVPEAIRAGVDLILDAGPLVPGVGSTVLDLTHGTARVLREGAVSAAAIRAALEGD
jgi:L-threonylcarbamoyladenylate synthase